MLWVKALHLFFVISWFAGVFYLPRLFVYHAMATDQATRDQLKVMERKLYRFVTPMMWLTIALGLWMLWAYAWSAWSSMGWLHAKIVLVTLLVIYHFYCGHLVKRFAADDNRRSHVWYRWFNEVPVLILLPVVILTIVKPF
ncbi:MAG TPA: protoporphyrinogen oxidase HemJ [Sedimenticola thiotaurini]|uniref:Protoporphyrinogen IX oxidase n=1 Tax=Sedimenticola thiotaurini TaxID=1543721 RepID=A0A831RMY5_9GAMM|nr:protoporphyrinogen oxidase HemJ [Sedimenticola thiotaurini]